MSTYKHTYKCPSCGQETDKNPHSPYADRYHKSGSHTLIQEYNRLLDAFNIQSKELETRISEAQKAEPQPTPRYGNPTVKVILEHKVWHDHNSPKIEKVNITTYLLNKEEGEAYLNRWGHRYGGWDEHRTSVSYYRTKEGILTHDGGGWILLKTPQLISEEEWAQLKAGNIPVRLFSN